MTLDYVTFASLRGAEWDRFERLLGVARRSPRSLGHAELETLAVGFRQILHDYALAGVRYPGTSAALRLRRLALAGANFLQRDQGEGVASLRRFLRVTFPQAFARLRGALLVSVALFVASALAGTALTAVRPGLGGAFLSPAALEQLRDGHLWTESLVTVVPANVSSSQIATNNISVALLAWTGGALAGLGSLWIGLLNGFLLGVVVTTTWHYGMAGPFLAFVAAHGPLEISLILVATAAGLQIGKAMVSTDDRPRAEALRRDALDSLAVVIGCAPWFVVLAVVEAFVSPSPAVPTALKAALGGALWLAFVAVALNPYLIGAKRVRP